MPLASDLFRALKVLATTPHIVQYLEQTDPKALTQARQALGLCAICGQGEPSTHGSEHKSSCPLWVSDEPLHDVEG
jgi:hypothetical protein